MKIPPYIRFKFRTNGTLFFGTISFFILAILTAFYIVTPISVFSSVVICFSALVLIVLFIFISHKIRITFWKRRNKKEIKGGNPK